MNRTVGRTPSNHCQTGFLIAQTHFLQRDVRRNTGDLVPPQICHGLMIGRIIGNITGIKTTFDTAYPVLQTRRSRFRPDPGLGLAVPYRWFKPFRLIEMLYGEGFKRIHIRNFPGLGCIRQIPVGQQHNRSHVLNRQANGLYRHLKTICRRCGGQDRHWRISMTAIERHVEIRLLSFCRKPGRGASALRVDNDQR